MQSFFHLKWKYSNTIDTGVSGFHSCVCFPGLDGNGAWPAPKNIFRRRRRRRRRPTSPRWQHIAQDCPQWLDLGRNWPGMQHDVLNHIIIIFTTPFLLCFDQKLWSKLQVRGDLVARPPCFCIPPKWITHVYGIFPNAVIFCDFRPQKKMITATSDDADLKKAQVPSPSCPGGNIMWVETPH